ERRTCDRRDVALSLRRPSGAGGLPARGAFLSPFFAALQAIAFPPAPQGGRAPRRARVPRASPRRRRARAVAGAATDGRPAEVPLALGVHGPRSLAPPHRRQARPLAAASAPIRRRRRAHAA